MLSGLRRYHHSGQSHFLTFSCYHREQRFHFASTFDLFLTFLEKMRVRFGVYVYGYVVMPEHVHLLVSEPDRQTLADARHYLKLSFTKRLPSSARVNVQKQDANPGHPALSGPFWQERGHDRNVRSAREFMVKLDYIHNNPVKRGLVKAAEDWRWSSFRHYAF
jgi:putative transposase